MGNTQRCPQGERIDLYQAHEVVTFRFVQSSVMPGLDPGIQSGPRVMPGGDMTTAKGQDFVGLVLGACEQEGSGGAGALDRSQRRARLGCSGDHRWKSGARSAEPGLRSSLAQADLAGSAA